MDAGSIILTAICEEPTNRLHTNINVAALLRILMAIPFLPPELIHPTFSLLHILNQNNDEGFKLQQFIKYFKKQWFTKILPEELSIFDAAKGTNNSAESYHCQLKSRIQCGHPRIWNFLKVLHDIIADTDNEMTRLQQGREITRPRKNKDVANDERRALCKEKLKNGVYTPLQFLAAISFIVGNVKEDADNSSEISDGGGSDSGDEVATGLDSVNRLTVDRVG